MDQRDRYALEKKFNLLAKAIKKQFIEETCDKCHGWGHVYGTPVIHEDTGRKTCTDCWGTGTIIVLVDGE